MKRLILFAALTCSCVTSDDLRQVAAQVSRLEVRGGATQEEVTDVVTEIDRIAADVAERTDSFVGSLSGAGAGGLAGILSLLTGIGVNMHRNLQRRRRGEPVSLLDQRLSPNRPPPLS